MELENYKVAVVFGKYWHDVRNIYCSCGYITSWAKGTDKECAKCGNVNILDGGDSKPPGENTKRFYDGIFTCIEKDDKSFHLSKQEINVKYHNNVVTFAATHVWEMKYNLKDKTAELTKNGQKAACHQHSYTNANQFFRYCRGMDSTIIPIFSTEKSKPLYEFAYRKFGSMGYERTDMLGRSLMRLLSRSNKLELFAFAGFGSNLSKIYSSSSWMDSTETKPHKIFNVPKYMLEVLRGLDTFDSVDTENLRKLDESVGGNNAKIIIEIFKEEASMAYLIGCVDMFTQLVDLYGYKDIKRLSLYLAREVKLEQGIDSPASAAATLRDYVRMCKDMETEPREKYPKSLKKLHDIAQMNYRIQADDIKNRQMKEAVESEEYQSLVYRKKPYAIITPNDASDLIKEGSSLSHCVASYVKDVISKKCKILFLRNIDQIEQPLVTIEIRDTNIRQVRGFANRAADRNEMGFVEEWAELNKLNLATH